MTARRQRNPFDFNPYYRSMRFLNHIKSASEGRGQNARATMPPKASSCKIRAALIDLSGTLHVSTSPIPGAVEACRRLQNLNIPVRFLTNTSKTSSSDLLRILRDMGFGTDCIPDAKSIMTSATAARGLLLEHKLRPMCLVEDILLEDLVGVDTSEADPNCVLVGLSPSALTYDRLNAAFRLLMKMSDEKAGQVNTEDDGKTISPLIAIHRGKYLRDGDGDLSLGPGGFVSCLEEASAIPAFTIGKPSASFFRSAISDWIELGISPEEILMVGDDVEQDVNGAIRAGIGVAVLVKTGKYREGDEEKLLDNGFACNDISEVVSFIEQSIAQKHTNM